MRLIPLACFVAFTFMALDSANNGRPFLAAASGFVAFVMAYGMFR